MARFTPLVWAVPVTLAVLVLAKGALQSEWTSQRERPRVSPAIIPRLDPPGRLHAPDDARPVAIAAKPAPLKIQPTQTRSALAPLSPGRDTRLVKGSASPAASGINSTRHEQQPTAIFYPIAESSEPPRMTETWPGAASPGRTSQRLPEEPHLAAAPRLASSPDSSEALAAVRQQVGTMNQKAVKLAQRGALYSARAELLDALRLIAQSQDASAGTAQCSAALTAALTAMEESDVFVRPETAQTTAIPLADIIRPHQTPVLKRIDVTHLSPLTCSQHYFAYAQQQLSLATGGNAAAAQSLHLLGKVHGNLAGQTAGGRSAHTARAIVFHQATLAIDQRHYQSANELGVLFARFGELTAARQMLLASVTSHATPGAWHNLAAVHDKLGEAELARLARHEAELIKGKPQSATSGPTVQWLDAATFAAQSPRAGADSIEGMTVRAAAATVPANQRNSATRR